MGNLSNTSADSAERRAFRHYLRTGQRPPISGIKLTKINPETILSMPDNIVFFRKNDGKIYYNVDKPLIIRKGGGINLKAGNYVIE